MKLKSVRRHPLLRHHQQHIVTVLAAFHAYIVMIEIAERLATELSREKVFYDEFYSAELARPNLDTYLQRIYHDCSDLVVVFLSGNYEDKEWCGLEWRAIRDLIKSRLDDKIMLIRFDDECVSGVFSIDGDTRGEQSGVLLRV